MARQRALSMFKNGELRVLVATDIASRGIDVNELSHVINFELPNVAETYVHRIGRTGRAGLSGVALSFCDAEERAYLKDINKLISQSVPVIEDQPFHSSKGRMVTPHPNNINRSAAMPRHNSVQRRERVTWSRNSIAKTKSAL
jgi:ATP-dependent RNA helicase RhlE